MDMTIKVEAPELCKAIYALAEALGGEQKPVQFVPAPEAAITETPEGKFTVTEEPTTGVTKEDIRKRLAGLASAGQQEKIKDLFACFNAKKLTEVDPAKYGELLALLDEAEVA